MFILIAPPGENLVLRPYWVGLKLTLGRHWCLSLVVCCDLHVEMPYLNIYCSRRNKFFLLGIIASTAAFVVGTKAAVIREHRFHAPFEALYGCRSRCIANVFVVLLHRKEIL